MCAHLFNLLMMYMKPCLVVFLLLIISRMDGVLYLLDNSVCSVCFACHLVVEGGSKSVCYDCNPDVYTLSKSSH